VIVAVQREIAISLEHLGLPFYIVAIICAGRFPAPTIAYHHSAGKCPHPPDRDLAQ